MFSSEQLAASIVQTLVNAGFSAYFAGGWVRDYLMGNSSSDIDIATDASPQEIISLFSKTIQVGISFGVVIVVLQGKNFEVSTFRKDLDYQDGRHPIGIAFSTAEEDAKRRDFTINGMFYDPLEDKILDYVGGVEDLKKGVIRTIGKPEERFAEDRLRMIRAVRFATRFNFSIDSETKEAIRFFAPTLFPAVSMERIWQELTKMAKLSEFHLAILDLYELNLLQIIFPDDKFSKKELECYVQPFDRFPSNCPSILYIQELFPHDSLSKRIERCRYLKTTLLDINLVEFYHLSAESFKDDNLDDYQWAIFYANSYSSLILEIAAAKSPHASAFLHIHEERQKKLFKHILRLQSKKPIVNAAFLQERGVQPGKQMGELIKRAEKLAINQNIEDPELILRLLLQ